MLLFRQASVPPARYNRGDRFHQMLVVPIYRDGLELTGEASWSHPVTRLYRGLGNDMFRPGRSIRRATRFYTWANPSCRCGGYHHHTLVDQKIMAVKGSVISRDSNHR